MDNAAPHVGLDERYSHGTSQAALSETVMYPADPIEVDDDPAPVKKARRSTSHLKAVPETLGQRNDGKRFDYDTSRQPCAAFR